MIKRGRPKTEPPIERKISPEKAVELVREYRSKMGRKGVSLGYIYNLISEGKLHRWGTKNCAELDVEEVKQVFKICG